MRSRPVLVRTRLSVMMFMEYFILGAWCISIGTYMADTLKLGGTYIGWIYSTLAIGAIISPLFVGYVADRLFATEKVLAVLHLVGGVSLFLAAGVGPGGFPRLMTLMMINTLCYMPTMALTNSLAFRNISDSEKDFPIIRVWGTIGWIAAGIIVGIALGETRPWFFHLAGGSAVVMALYCLSLPHTPPNPAAKGEGDVLGLRALRLLGERSFAVFTLAAALVGVTASFYVEAANIYLTETGRPVPTALQTLGQFSEIFFMAAMPWFIARLGLRRILTLGIAAWMLRYLCFTSFSFPLVLLGIILHGVCYDFFFVAAFIYVDKRAPQDLRASAQSFIAFVMMGVGQFAGMIAAGHLLEEHACPLTVTAVDGAGDEVEDAPLPQWPSTQPYEGFWRYLDLKETVRGLIAGEEVKEVQEVSLAGRLGSDRDDRIALAKLERLPDVLKIDDMSYAKRDLIEVFRRVDADQDGIVTRPEWRAATAHRWPAFWLWPFGIALATGVFFWFGFGNSGKVGEGNGT